MIAVKQNLKRRIPCLEHFSFSFTLHSTPRAHARGTEFGVDKLGVETPGDAARNPLLYQTQRQVQQNF